MPGRRPLPSGDLHYGAVAKALVLVGLLDGTPTTVLRLGTAPRGRRGPGKTTACSRAC